MKRCLPVLISRIIALCATSAISSVTQADSSITKVRTVTEIGAGLYAIRHADSPDDFPQGNTTVIIGDRAVLVIDSGYLPSSAREDIAQIKQWTSKPVRFLLNTHWHPDHQRGNLEYLKAFPDATIISQHETAKLIGTYDAANLQRRPLRLASMKATIESGRHDDGTPLSPTELGELREALAGSRAVSRELGPGFHLELPMLTFDREINVELGNRPVEIRHLGQGDTLGDAWVYLPQEKVLITGDVLVHPVPYFFAGYPSGLLSTLRHLERLDPRTIVPGHGAVLHDKSYLQAVIDLLDTVIREVNQEVVRAGSLSARLENVRKAIDLSRYRKQFARDDTGSQQYFDESMEGLVRDAFNQAPK